VTHVPEALAEVLFSATGNSFLPALRQGGCRHLIDRRSIRFFSVFVIQLASQISFSFCRWDGLVAEILEPLRVVAEVV